MYCVIPWLLIVMDVLWPDSLFHIYSGLLRLNLFWLIEHLEYANLFLFSNSGNLGPLFIYIFLYTFFVPSCPSRVSITCTLDIFLYYSQASETLLILSLFFTLDNFYFSILRFSRFYLCHFHFIVISV